MPAGAEPVQEAGPSGNVPAERREPLRMEDMLLQTRVALDMVTEQYNPMFAALRETGTLLRTNDVLEYPARIRKLQRKLIRSRERENELTGQLQGIREAESESAALLKGFEEELQRKVAYINKMEAHVQRKELQIREQEDTIRSVAETSRQCVSKLSGLFQSNGEAQTKARLYDERVLQPGLEGAARMKNVVREYSDKVEAYLVEFRVLAECIRESSSEEESDQEEPTSRTVVDVEPIHMARPAGVSPEEVRDLSEGMEAMDVHPDRAEKQQEGQPAGRGTRGDRPADPILVGSPEDEE